ncbi:endonuclease V-like [Hippocampus comes]|uniref:endonuclease V-like n=1 Tax=Hippocampus comes TaxID=109280 RepID=UPI00094ED27F|nr:PREDICTED: endonuclease V-like [Hippocampus comes]
MIHSSVDVPFIQEAPFIVLAHNAQELLPASFHIMTSDFILFSVISALQKGGDSFPLRANSGKVLGKALRSSDRSTKPVYVSVGHKISLDTAVQLTYSCSRFRVPEPIRQVPKNTHVHTCICHLLKR